MDLKNWENLPTKVSYIITPPEEEEGEWCGLGMRPGDTWPHSQANPHRFIYTTYMYLHIRAIYFVNILLESNYIHPRPQLTKGLEAKLSLWVERAALYMLNQEHTRTGDYRVRACNYVKIATGWNFRPDYGLLLELHALTLVARSYALLAQDIPTRGSHVEVFLTRSDTFYLQWG